MDGFDKLREGDFALIQHFEVSFRDFRSVWGGAGVGASDGHQQATALGLSDLHLHVILLDDHSGDHHQFGPLPFGFGDFTHVAVHQLHLPLLGEQSRNGGQPQGWQQHLAVHQFKDFLVAPERLGELGVEKEGAHG